MHALYTAGFSKGVTFCVLGSLTNLPSYDKIHFSLIAMSMVIYGRFIEDTLASLKVEEHAKGGTSSLLTDRVFRFLALTTYKNNPFNLQVYSANCNIMLKLQHYVEINALDRSVIGETNGIEKWIQTDSEYTLSGLNYPKRDYNL